MSIYYGITLDPLHIGAGGYRLGRVDNTIIRDAASGLPKVPGSSLAGVVRSYAVLTLKDEDQKLEAMMCATASGTAKGNCGQCKVCKLFGYASDGEKTNSRMGLLRFYDGRIVAFPVRTLHGPVWLVSPSTLKNVGVTLPQLPDEEELLTNFHVSPAVDNKEARLNFGWLYMPVKEMREKAVLDSIVEQLERIMPQPQIAVAPDWLFSEMVNSGLEVRTSVSIDPGTGAAEEGKLFTYEAIPAATLLAFDITLDELRMVEQGESVMEAKAIVETALKQCALLGMGGMSTRGFGRIRFFWDQEAV